jgi:aryl-alcohol dehydrogenase
VKIEAAATRAAGGAFFFDRSDSTAPRTGEVLVQVVATGIFGQEGAGIVRTVGPGVTKVRPGDPVVMRFGLRDAIACRATLRDRDVVKVPSGPPLELLAPLACDIQTGAAAVLDVLKVRAGSSLVIAGADAIGLSAVMAAHLVKAGQIIAIDANRTRRRLALALGATAALDPASCDVAAAIAALCPSGADRTLDCTAPPGIVGGDALPDIFIPYLVDLHRAGLFPFDRLVRVYPFAEIATAIRDAESGAVVKPIIRMPAPSPAS